MIAHVQELVPGPCDGQTRAGARVTMTDGSIWFHPYNGSQPTQLQPARVYLEDIAGAPKAWPED